MKKSLLFGFATAMALASCTTNEEVMDIAKQQEMSFSAFANKSTKAPISDLKTDEGTFGLFAYKTKNGEMNEPVFVNTAVTYDATKDVWTPAVTRYWDRTCSYAFFAYAPSDVVSGLITCAPANDLLGNPAYDSMTITGFEVDETVDDQKDVLIATKVQRVNFLESSPLVTTPVDFTFHHILTKVNIQFAKGEGEQKTVLKSIRLKDVPTKGNCVVTFNSANAVAPLNPLTPIATWTVDKTPTPKTYGGELGNDSIILDTDFDTAIENLLMIPQSFTNLDLDIVFTVNTEKFTRTVNLALVEDEWSPNTNLTYQLTIMNGSSAGGTEATDKIEVGVTEVKDWTDTTPKPGSSIN